MSADFSAEAEGRYREAVERRQAIREASKSEGAPLLATGSTGWLVEHPLVRMLREHDLLVDRLAAAAHSRLAAPQPSAVLKPSIGPTPAAELRAVGMS